MDVLSTLLLVFTFLLSVFMVAQFYVSQESTGKDSVLRRLQRQIAELTTQVAMHGAARAFEVVETDIFSLVIDVSTVIYEIAP